jgi:hypothetical protein
MKLAFACSQAADFDSAMRRFESSRPSQPVRSLLFDFRLCKYCRHSGGLCGARESLAGKFRTFGSEPGGFAAPVSARHFPISVSACPRPVRYVTETGLRSCVSSVAANLFSFRIRQMRIAYTATLDKVLINRADYQIGGGVALRLRTQGIHFYLNWAKERLDEMDATLASLETKVSEVQADARVTPLRPEP